MFKERPIVIHSLTLREMPDRDHAIFEANDLYYGGRPNIDTYTVRIVPSQEIAFQMLKNGEIDYTSITPDQYADDLDMRERVPASEEIATMLRGERQSPLRRRSRTSSRWPRSAGSPTARTSGSPAARYAPRSPAARSTWSASRAGASSSGSSSISRSNRTRADARRSERNGAASRVPCARAPTSALEL